VVDVNCMSSVVKLGEGRVRVSVAGGGDDGDVWAAAAATPYPPSKAAAAEAAGQVVTTSSALHLPCKAALEVGGGRAAGGGC